MYTHIYIVYYGDGQKNEKSERTDKNNTTENKDAVIS